MTDHDDAEAFALGALDAHEAAAFERHLAQCAQCRAAVASYAPVMQALHGIPAQAPPAPPMVHSRSYWREAVAAVVLLGLGATGATLSMRSPDADFAAIAAMVADRPTEIALSGAHGRGSIVLGHGRQRTAFVIDGLPPPPPGHGYQVWVRGAAVHSPGMLHRTRDGLEILVVPEDVTAGAHHVGITIEPSGGSATRTGDVQVEGDV